MPEIIKINAGKLVGVKTSIFTIFNQEKYDPAAIPAAWQAFFRAAQATELKNQERFYGASIPSMSLDVPMDYFAGTIVNPDFKVPSGFETVNIPEGNYLSILHAGPITEIASSYSAAYMHELPASGQVMRPAPHLEIYDPKLDPMSPDYSMVIAIPTV
jgi:predicted transcriptional regulator YdeE